MSIIDSDEQMEMEEEKNTLEQNIALLDELIYLCSQPDLLWRDRDLEELDDSYSIRYEQVEWLYQQVLMEMGHYFDDIYKNQSKSKVLYGGYVFFSN